LREEARIAEAARMAEVLEQEKARLARLATAQDKVNLFKAAVEDDVPTIERILQTKDIKINELVDISGSSVLLIAAAQGSANAVKYVLDNGGLIENRDNVSPILLTIQQQLL
jgi:hypothetical protein